MHLGASSAFGVVGRLENASPVTASAFRTIFLKMWTPWWRYREWGGEGAGLTHCRGILEWGHNECRGGWEAMPCVTESDRYKPWLLGLEFMELQNHGRRRRRRQEVGEVMWDEWGSYVDGRNWWNVLKLRGGNLPAYLKMQLGHHYGWK